MKKLLLGTALFMGIHAGAQNFEFWGLTQASGDNNKGTIYKVDSSGSTSTVVYSFIDGDKPTGSLLLASNGKLYGSTSFGGSDDYGIIFSIDPITEVFTKHWDLTPTTGGRTRGSLMQASNGMLYMTTYEGGMNGKGTILELDPSTNNLIIRHHFGATASDPTNPMAGELIELSNGMLYGTTRFGGNNDDGTIYEYDLSTHTVTKIHDFSSASNGAHPFSSLTLASNGLVYGLTYEGGPTNGGVLFAYDVAVDTFQVQEYFSNAGTVGTKPQAALIEAADGLLYGTTSNGGYLFAFDTQTKDVTGINSVGDTRGTMLEASNGNLYGTTYTGTLFKYDPVADAFNNLLGTGIYSLYGAVIEVPVGGAVSLEENNLSKVNVFPNPATNWLNIEGDVLSVEVYDLSGKLVQSEFTNSFSVANLASGSYVIKVITEEGISRSQFVKQ